MDTHVCTQYCGVNLVQCRGIFNPFKPEFTIVIFIWALQAANCCRNSRLVVDEDDLKRVKQ